MTLDEALNLLVQNNISYEVNSYDNEAAFYQHIKQFSNLKNAKKCSISVIVIKSKNANKNIELQFNAKNNDFNFEELWFGGYCFELFDCEKEILPQEIIKEITDIMQLKTAVILVTNLKNKRCIADASFDLEDNDDKIFGKIGYDNAIKKINKPISIISKLLNRKNQYEIYDFENYKCIIK